VGWLSSLLGRDECLGRLLVLSTLAIRIGILSQESNSSRYLDLV
jgi:hypothetical protein